MGGALGFGIQSETTTTSGTGGTALFKRLPPYTTSVLLRAAASNADNIYVSFGQVTAKTGDIILRAGETVSLDITNALMLKQMLWGSVKPSDFIEQMSYVSATASQTFYFDAFTMD